MTAMIQNVKSGMSGFPENSKVNLIHTEYAELDRY